MDDESTFKDLLERVRQGDEQAATDLVQHFEPELRRFVRYRLNTPKMRRFLDSVDICQSVFANFFVRIVDGQFDLRHSRQLQQLLLTMASNKMLDQVRKQHANRRGGEGVAVGETVDWLADPSPGPGTIIEARDVVAVLRTRLTAEEQDLLDQWMNGDEWAVIAARINGSAEALRKRFTRAVDRAAQELGWEVKS